MRDRDGSVALEAAGRAVTWSELDARAEDLAARLAYAGVGPGRGVLLRLPPSVDHVVAVLATARCQGFVAPLGPEPTAGSVDRIVHLAGPVVEVETEGSVEKLAAGPAGRGVHPGAAAVLLTSGSTGLPKAVVVSAAGLDERIAWGAEAFFSDDARRVAMRSHPMFIDSLTELLGALRAGATLHVPPRSATSDLTLLARFLADERIQQVTLAPSALPALARSAPSGFPALRRWLLSGEPLRTEWVQVARALAPGAEIINSYGSTEVTGDVAFSRFPPGVPVPDPVPIGRVVDGVAWRLEPVRGEGGGGVHGEAAGPGDQELWIGGDQVALDVLGAPDGAIGSGVGSGPGTPMGPRWVGTGDLVSADDGVLTFVGRRDRVVQVRGRRVDVGAVEAVLAGLPGVSEAAAGCVEPAGGSARLEAVVVGIDAADPPDPLDLRRQMEALLPRHLVPDAVAVVPHLPRTPSGKVDRVALRSAAAVRASGPPEPSPSFSFDLELAVARVVEEVCEGLVVDRATSLADLGVDSLQAVVVAARLVELLGVEVTPVDLFGWGSVAAIATGILGRDPAAATCLRRLRAGDRRWYLFLPPAIGSCLAYYRLLPFLPAGPTAVGVEATDPALVLIETDGWRAFGDHVAAAVGDESPDAVSLVGWSFGALLVPDVARALLAAGVPVDGTVLIDPAWSDAVAAGATEDWALRRILSDFGYGAPVGTVLDVAAAMDLVRVGDGLLRGVSGSVLARWSRTMAVNLASRGDRWPEPPPVPTLVIRARPSDGLTLPRWASAPRSSAALEVADVDATHFELLRGRAVEEVGSLTGAFLSRVGPRSDHD